uniref:Uncharacterized protein n=1 Tax=Glossina austeni TaxID=7395 RepID=A0A1A9V3R4_GLOAU
MSRMSSISSDDNDDESLARVYPKRTVTITTDRNDTTVDWSTPSVTSTSKIITNKIAEGVDACKTTGRDLIRRLSSKKRPKANNEAKSKGNVNTEITGSVLNKIYLNGFNTTNSNNNNMNSFIRN